MIEEDIITSEEELINSLTKYYPDKKVRKLSLRPKLYYYVKKYANQKNLKIDDYLKSFDFVNMGGSNEVRSYNQIKNELAELFPDKEYESLKAIKEVNEDLYKDIVAKSSKDSITTTQFLKELGYEKVGKKSNNINDTYDAFTLNKLVNEYDASVSELSQILNCTRENIYRQIRNEISNKNKNGWKKTFALSEIDEVLMLIKHKHYKKVSKEKAIIILSNKEKFEKKAVFYKSGEYVKCMFQMDGTIEKALKENFFDILNQGQFNKLHDLKALWINQGRIMNGKNRVIRVNTKQRMAIRNTFKNNNLSFNESLELFDFEITDNRFSVTDQYIIETIEKYIVKDNIVRIRVKDPDYQQLASIASRRNLSGIEGIVNYYGYSYEKGRDTSDVTDKHIKNIKKKYIIKDNEIYISSLDPFYGTLRAFAYNRKIDFDELFVQWGFKRIKNRSDLPKGYIPYDYSGDLQKRLSTNWDEDSIKMILEQLADKDKKVYLDINSYFYYILFLKAKSESSDINSIIESLGFIRSYECNDDYKERNDLVEKVLSSNKDKYIKEKLKRLENIQLEYKEVVSEEKRIERNHKLVSTLKSLYQGRCQLCGNEEPTIPSIRLKKGDIYCEVHHIRQFSSIKNNGDDLEEIDNYKNAIVLCPYHHAYLHYDDGGDYSKIINKGKNEVYLQNSSGKSIKININYHLK